MGASSLQTSTAYVPLSYCVRMVQMDLEDYTTTQYEKLLQYAIRGFEKLHFTTIASVKVAYLTMNDLNIVELPNDFIQYYKIGINVGGRLWNLGLNNDIILPREEECGDDARELFQTDHALASTFGFFYTDHFLDGGFVGGLFGFGGGFREAHYRIDVERNQILFDSLVPRDEIVLEYRSSGISAQTLVPRPAIDVMVAYMHWRRLKGRRRDSERAEAEREWKEELSEFRAFKMRFNPTEYLDMLHGEWIQTPKR